MGLRNQLLDLSRPLADTIAPSASTTLIFGEPEVLGDRMLISVHETDTCSSGAATHLKPIGSIEITDTTADFFPIADRRRWVPVVLALLILLACILIRAARR